MFKLFTIFFIFMLISCNYDYDQEYITNNYIYEDIGRYEKYISYIDENKDKKIVIDSRVDDYSLIGNDIYVARRPRFIVKTAEGFFKQVMSRKCEYYILHSIDGSVEIKKNLPMVKCS